jgi:hypothetical protein
MHDDESFDEAMSHDHGRQPHSLARLLSSMADVLRKSSWELVCEASSTDLHAQQTIAQCLPDFIKPPSNDVGSGSLDYLQASGAFDLPLEAAQRSLLRAYLLGVHYSMPCVDVHQLLRAQRKPSEGKDTISLVLYQAVMFAGAMYVEQSVLENMGYTSRQVALRELFRRAKARSSVSLASITTHTNTSRSFSIVWSLTKTQPVLSRHCCCSLFDRLLPPSSKHPLAGYSSPST